MNKILSEFINEMDLLKLYIEFQNESYRNQSKIEKLNANSKYDILTTAKIKQFDFNSHIISIYGSFEHFIEQIFSKYLKDISSISKSFESLPIEIQNNNLAKTLEILKQLDYRKNKNLKPEKLIEILHNNINLNAPTLNIEAFKNHSANFRIGTIDTYFAEIGIKNLSSLIKQYEPLKKHLEDSITDYSSKKSNIIFQILEIICDLRNDIAHGVQSIQLVNKNILFEYIEFIKIFAITLYEFVTDSYLEKVFSNLSEEIEVINVFNNHILCFNTKGKIISNDTIVIAYSENHFPKYFKLEIGEIQHNGISIEKTTLNHNIDIGIKVENKIKSNMIFKILK